MSQRIYIFNHEINENQCQLTYKLEDISRNRKHYINELFPVIVYSCTLRISFDRINRFEIMTAPTI